jgi:hypothetical protein
VTELTNSTYRKAALPVLLFAFVICSFLVGISFGVTCLQDPDTCWMLKMGEVISRDRAIPKKDPFSVNAQNVDGKPHVYYQWLSEVAYYQSFEKNLPMTIGGLSDDQIMDLPLEERREIPLLKSNRAIKGPMLLGSLLCAGAFLVFPLLNFLLAPKRFLSVPILILAATQASSFHFYLRPELFSAFMFSLELLILNRIRLAVLADSTHHISIWSVVQICVLMILWCNLHCGFVLGLIVLLLFAFTQTLSLTQIESKRNLWLMFGLGTLSTLINPWGVDLWIYLFKLFSSPVGSRVEELQPLSFFELFGQTYSLYVVFALATLALLVFAFIKLRANKPLPVLLFSCVATAMVLVMGIGARRLIPFACILGVFEWTLILSIIFSRTKPDEALAVREEKRSTKLAPAMYFLVFALAIFGTWWESGLFKLQLPQFSYGFPPPYEAIRYLQYANRNALESERIRGQGLNDPQFGDMMIYYLGKDSRVFIDTRFDVYPDKIVFDFLTMANCQNGWEKLLDEYKIAWIFLPQHTQLATYANKHPEQWTTVYTDDTALISRRQKFDAATK